MGKVERLLEAELENEIQELGKLELGTEKYKTTGEVVAKLADKAIEFEKIRVERNKEDRLRDFEENFKMQQMKDEKRDRFVKNCLTGVSIVTGIAVPFVISIMSMNFEREGTFTTEAGRSALRELLNFKRKS